MTKNTFCYLPFITLDRAKWKDVVSPSPCAEFMTNSKHQSIHDWINSDELKKVREQLLNGERPTQCRRCWQVEDKGQVSLRMESAKDKGDVIESFVRKHNTLKISEIKMRSGSSCNLACRMCVPQSSNQVDNVWKAIGRERLPQENYDIEMEMYIRSNIEDIKYIQVLGGEPFNHKKIINLLKWIVDSGHSGKIKLNVFTNGMLMNDRMFDQLQKFKMANITFSLEAHGEVNDYIRQKSDWNTIEKNMMTSVEKGLAVQVQSTLSVLNICRIHVLQDWCQSKGIHFKEPIPLITPIELAAGNLPQELNEHVDPRYKKYLLNTSHPDMYKFISQMDQYWNTDIRKVMPEWNKVM